MSEKLFEEKEVKLFGLYKYPLYNRDYLFYYQNLFVSGEVEKNFPFIKVCNGDKSDTTVLRDNLKFLSSIDGIISETSPDYNPEDDYDSEDYMLHGTKVKALIFRKEILALGNLKENYWLSTNNFLEKVNNIEKFKKKFLVNRVNNAISTFEDYYIKKEEMLNSLLKDLKDIVDSYNLLY